MISPEVHGFFDPITATWSYVVWTEGDESRACAIIDTVLDYDIHSGRTKTASADRVIAFVKNKGLKPQWILETHIHADHLTAARYIKDQLGGRTAISHHILKVLETWQPVFNTADTPLDGYQFDHLFADDEVFAIGALEARIIHTPGHTPADTTYIIGDAVFAGDALFLPDVGTGRCDFPGGNAADSYDSVQKLLALPGHYRLYVGHDYPPADGRRLPQCMATIAEQRAHNIRMREGTTRAAYVEKRNRDDAGKDVPKLLLPSIQVNLRAGGFGAPDQGVQYVKLPVDKI